MFKFEVKVKVFIINFFLVNQGLFNEIIYIYINIKDWFLHIFEIFFHKHL